MERDVSAILQMLTGERGNLESVRLDEEYLKAQGSVVQLEEAFVKLLSEEAARVYTELENAKSKKELLYARAVYAEAFSFAFALSQEIDKRK